MAINEERSYTEYNVEIPTTDFPIGFDILDDGVDVVAVTLNDVDPTTLGYTVIQVNNTTYRFAPAVHSGVVRLTRITDIDQMAHVFTEGAIFISENMDGNFKQIRHSQQEVRDSFEKLELEVDAAVVVSNNAAELALEASVLANSASGLATQASNDVIDTNTIVQTSGEVDVTLSDGAVVPNMNKRIAYYGNKVLSVNGEVGDVVIKAENLTTLNGNTQQDINDRGGATWYVKLGGYNLNDRVILGNGDEVISTEPNNITNPNIDMTGWFNETLATQSTNKNLFFTQARPFSNFIDAVDISPILQSYANSLSDGDTITIPAGKWAIKSLCNITKNINIRCDGDLVVGGDINAYLKFSQSFEVELDASLHLSQLPKTGDTKLYLNATGLALLSANPAQYFFTLNSTEIEIVRIGYADPYYKNETLAFLDSALTVRGQIDLTYTDASKLKIKMYRKQKSTRVQLNMSMQPTAGQTTGARVLEVEGVNSIVWDVVIDRSNSALIAGTSFKYKNCTNFTFLPSCKISGGQSDVSDSYAYLNEASSYILYQGNADYYDIGTSTKKERGYAARHGKYVYFNFVNFNGIDDHYGHHYYIGNMDLTNRGIGIAGGAVTVENVRQLGGDFLMQQRLDTPYNDGKLRMINCYAKTGLLIAEATDNAAYNSKYKSWDEIELIDCSSDAYENWQHGIRFTGFLAQNVNTKTKKLTIRNFGFNRISGNAQWLKSASEHFIDVDIDNITLSSSGAFATSAMSTGVQASGEMCLNKIRGLDGSWISATMDIDKSKLGFSTDSSLLLLSTGDMNISKTNLSNDLSAFSSASNQGAVTLLGNKINSTKYFDNSNFRNAVIAGFANQVNIAINFDGDLRNYQKTKPVRYLQTTYALGTLAVGAVTAVQTVAVSGARIGDPVDWAFTTGSNGLRCNPWVSATDTVKYYIENPTANPNGSQTFANIGIRLTVRSN